MKRKLNHYESKVREPHDLTDYEAKTLLLMLADQLGFTVIKEKSPDYCTLEIVKSDTLELEPWQK